MKKFFIIVIILIAFVLSGTTAIAKTTEPDCLQMLINDEHKLTAGYQPDSLTYLSQVMHARYGAEMAEEATAALAEMAADMETAGLTDIYGQSCYRSYSLQDALHQRKYYYFSARGYGAEEAALFARQVVARPGASEHQSGLAIDFSTWDNGRRLDESFAKTPLGSWLAENSWKYGFILRYPQDKTEITGITYEPWHFRYVGSLTAEILAANNLCLEEYLSLLEEEKVITYTSINGNNYAIYLCQESSIEQLGSSVVSISQAYADSTVDYIIVTEIEDPAPVISIGVFPAETLGISSKTIFSGKDLEMGYRWGGQISRDELVMLLSRAYTLVCSGEQRENEDIQNLVYLHQVFSGGQGGHQSFLLDNEDISSREIYNVADLAAEEIPIEYIWDKPSLGSSQKQSAMEIVQMISQLSLAVEKIPSSNLAIDDIDYEDKASLLAAINLLADAGIIQESSLGQNMITEGVNSEQLCLTLNNIRIIFEEDLAQYIV